ncbi:MAG: prepilin-type cleavage/methylation domain-containing protein [Parachlamydiaceae bacterium]
MRRLPITLLEVLIVFALLALVSGVVAISINKALIDQRFSTEVGQIVEELRLAQNIMSILKADVHVIFEEDVKKDGINYWLETDTLLPAHIKREVTRRKILKTVKGVFLKDQLPGESHEGRLDIKFMSYGAVMSKGVLRLASTDNPNPPEGTLQSYICLIGYPHPITSSDSKEKTDKECSNADEDFNTQLTEDTMQRIPEKAKKQEPSRQKV